MLSWITSLMDRMGHVAALIVMFLDNVLPPIPSELVMPFAEFTAAQARLPLWCLLLAGTVGSVLGALPLYYVGKILGQDRLKRFADRHGKWLTLSGDDIDAAMKKFDHHGSAAVFVCRLIPGVRSLISIPAGICGMKLPRFLLYTTAGSVIWTAALAYAGHKLGENYHAVEKYLGPVTYIVLGALALWAIITIIKRRRHQSHRNQPEAQPGPVT